MRAKCEIEDGPAVLQVHKWRGSHCNLGLSEVCEAFISPTRQHILFSSHNNEAALLGLVPERQLPHSVLAVGAEMLPGEETRCDGGTCENFSAVNATSSKSDCSSVFEVCPVISHAKSVAWGHCRGYGSRCSEGLFYDDIFVVSGRCGGTEHLFCHVIRNSQIADSVPKVGQLHGRWIDWGPFHKDNVIRCTNSSNISEDKCSSCDSPRIMKRRWLRSYLTEVTSSVIDDKYVIRFPKISSIPASVDIISFDIFEITLAFLDFLKYKKNVGGRNAPDLSERLENWVPKTQTSHNTQVECLKVFADPSNHLMGLVLNSIEGQVCSTDQIQGTSNDISVVVIEMHDWGMDWIFSADMKNSCDGQCYSLEWVDFQFSENFLLCLNTSGIVAMFDIRSQMFVCCFDTVQICAVDMKSFTSKTVSILSNNEATHNQGRDNIAKESGNFCKKPFKRLVVSSNSPLLAIIDESSVIYVFSIYDNANGNCLALGKCKSCAVCHDSTSLDPWATAGQEIGGMLQCADSSADAGMGNTVPIRPSNMQKNSNFHGNEEDTWLSGFCIESQISDRKHFHSHTAVGNPLRKVILPLCKMKDADVVVLSLIGITRIIKEHIPCYGKTTRIVHTELLFPLITEEQDQWTNLQDQRCSFMRECFFGGDSVACSFGGYLYLMTLDGIYIVLPSVSASLPECPTKAITYWQPAPSGFSSFDALDVCGLSDYRDRWKPWQVEILDRMILYEGPAEVDRLCHDNGWDLKVARLRQLQLALHYLNIEDLKRSLDMLLDVNLVEDGILQLLLASVYRIICSTGSDGEAVLSLRLLNLVISFATKILRCYGLQNREGLPNEARRLHEMALYLEVARNLRGRLSSKINKFPSRDNGEDDAFTNIEESQNIISPPAVSPDFVSAENFNNAMANHRHSVSSVAELVPGPSGDLALALTGADMEITSFESIKDMLVRWETNKFDIHTVVKEALQSARLPLAVLQLQLLTQRESTSNESSFDTFHEVHRIGRSFAYDLFIKGDIRLAIAILERVGDDVESVLRQLLFGTTQRTLRLQIAEEMKQRACMRSDEAKMLEQLSHIEMLYPSNRFWRSFTAKQKIMQDLSLEDPVAGEEHPVLMLHVRHYSLIKCGDIDGTVIGYWANISKNSNAPEDCDNKESTGYWACAAVWFEFWDQRTVNRVLLDKPSQNIFVSWESQMEYYIIHGKLENVCRLIDAIPVVVLSEGVLRVMVDNPPHVANGGHDVALCDNELYISASDELDSLCEEVLNIKILRPSINLPSVLSLRIVMEWELAKKDIFLKEYWCNIDHTIQILARASKIIPSKRNEEGELSEIIESDRLTSGYQSESVVTFHNLVVQFCVQHNLPFLLDLYVEHHDLLQDADSLNLLKKVVGDCQWAKWLLFSRIKGFEYDASFCNACWNLSQSTVSSSNLNVIDIDCLLHTVDDMAEHKGEIAALATLMYAPVPIQKSLCTGSINRNCGVTFQCTLENLQPGLHQFPTLQKTLFSFCFGRDIYGSLSSSRKNYFGKSTISDYLSWRYNIFSSAGGDTSLLQMLPFWFSKSIRRLVQLFEQGPFGLQLWSGTTSCEESFLHSINNFIFSKTGYNEISAVSLEAAIQKSIEQELFTSLEEDFRVEHHLHRGRPLAAFSHLLSKRASQFKTATAHQDNSAEPNIQAGIQLMLEPLSQSERSVLLSVAPLAVTSFEDVTLVASCAFLLELCGLSASMLCLDVAALQRISSYYKSMEQNVLSELASPVNSTIHALSNETNIASMLARSLAEDYIHSDYLNILERKPNHSEKYEVRYPSPLIPILQQLEIASLPTLVEGKTCGYSLLNHISDTSFLRSQQNEASQRWKLVTDFCLLHHLPISTKYLALLANDNDWVGFLTEAQLGQFPIDVVIQLAAKEIRDPRLRTHIITVLKNMHPSKEQYSYLDKSLASVCCDMSVSADECGVRMELFGILAECEMQANPGAALLRKAKDMRWSLLALIASCFSDVTSLSCFSVWLEITASRETSSVKVDDIFSKIAKDVGSAVNATNSLPTSSRCLEFRYNRRNPKRRRFMETSSESYAVDSQLNHASTQHTAAEFTLPENAIGEKREKMADEEYKVSVEVVEELSVLLNVVALLCEQHLFLPLLRAFDLFLPSCSLLPFLRALQAFLQMRISDASALLASFSNRIKEESSLHVNMPKDSAIKPAWVVAIAVKAADAVLITCPSVYERKSLLQLLAAVNFADGGSTQAYFCRLHWKINLVEPCLCKDGDVYQWDGSMDDASLLKALVKNGCWEKARSWARQLESSDSSWKSAVHHVTESQADAMVAEWKEFLWDVPQERAALWSYCQALFMKYSFPPLEAGLFFLKHADEVGKDIPARELHEILLLSLQWLSGTITQSQPVYPIHLLREIETRVWLLAVESEASDKLESANNSFHYMGAGSSCDLIEQTGNIISKMDSHLNATHVRVAERTGIKSSTSQQQNFQLFESDSDTSSTMRMKRRAKIPFSLKRTDMNNDAAIHDDVHLNSLDNLQSNSEPARNILAVDDFSRVQASLSGWDQSIQHVDMERAVLSLLESGQIAAAKQLQQKMSPSCVPQELVFIDVAIKLAKLSSSSNEETSLSLLDCDVLSIMESLSIPWSNNMVIPSQVLDLLVSKCGEGRGQSLLRRIIAVLKAANVLGLSFMEAFEKPPVELLQLLSLKAQDSLEEAKLLVQTHSIPAASIARILSESFLKGLLAAHRAGYLDFQKDEDLAPLLWRSSDFLKWAELCPSESEVGHALMRLVLTGHDVPRACEVELLILSQHFYMSSACLDGVDVLVTFVANRVESYVLEGDFSCLARLITGVSNFRSLNFILNILIEYGQLELLLQKYSITDASSGSPASVRGFRMAVLTSLNYFTPRDLDAFSMVYKHFDMKHEVAALLESRSAQYVEHWLSLRHKYRQSDELLEAMRHLVETAEVLSSIDAGQRTHCACARASLLSLQIRIPDTQWINLEETNARRILVGQSRFQEALIVAEAYNLNHPTEWTLVFWNQILKPDLIEQFVSEFVMVLALQPSMLLELARFYRQEVAARGEQLHFSLWPGVLPAEFVKHIGRSFRSLLKRTRDLRLRMQLAGTATGFVDVVDACNDVLDKVPEGAGPLIVRKGHGGAYLPLM